MLQTYRVHRNLGDPIPQLHLNHQHPKEKWDEMFLGVKLQEDHYDMLIDFDCDVYTPEGELLCKFRRNVLPRPACEQAFKVLRTIESKTLNRGIATGKNVPKRHLKKDGTVSKTAQVDHNFAVMSNIIGYFDRYTRTPFCRQTAFNANHPELFAKVLPFLQAVDATYQKHAPDRYALQKEVSDRTHPDFVIKGTAFTTITVNKNWQTAVHTDQGDLKAGLSCITALRGGVFHGGYLVFPHYRIAVDLGTTDLLMFDSHHMHGNTPIRGQINAYERVSCVLYFRENMVKCKSAAEELERAKNRKPGDPIWDDE